MAGTFDYDLFISYATADAAWVEGYLLDALSTAGARVHTEAAFELGAPRLTEFEEAIKRSKRALLVLSPAYLAEDVDAFADLFAITYGLESGTWPVIPLVLQPVELPPRLAVLTRLDATDPVAWADVVERLLADLERPVPAAGAAPPCPYPGMVPFAEDDARFFFGRETEIDEMLALLRLHPFLAVIGPSGSGKSSLVFAGVLPALRRTMLFGPDEWMVRSLRPGPAPMTALAAALGSEQTEPEGLVFDALVQDKEARRLLVVVDQFEEIFTVAGADETAAFLQAVDGLAKVDGCFVILTARADFYPELMACSLWPAIDAHRAEVLPLHAAGLHDAIVRPAEAVGVYVEGALVERLVTDAAGEPGALPLVQETLALLWDRLERRFLPLRAYEGLVLPRRAYGGTLRAVTPERTGLQVALARRADAMLAELPGEEQAIAHRIFVRLVQFGEGRADTRRQQLMSDLGSVGDDPGRVERVVQHLAAGRLLTVGGVEGHGERRVDLSHEALIGSWPRLQRWLAERREAEHVRRRLEAKAAEWVRLGQGGNALLDAAELAEAERWLASPDAADLGYGASLPALVEASRTAIDTLAAEQEAARQRELALERRRAEEQALAAARLRRWLVAAVGLALVALLTAFAAFYAFDWARDEQKETEAAERTAVAERMVAEAASTQVVAQEATAAAERERTGSLVLAARAMDYVGSQLDLALLLGLEAHGAATTMHGRASLMAGALANPRLTSYLHGTGGAVRSVAFSSDGKHVAAGAASGVVDLWSLSDTSAGPRQLDGPAAGVDRVAFHPDGTSLVVAGCGERESGGSCARVEVRVWEVATGRPLGTSNSPIEAGARVIALSADGSMLAAGGCRGPAGAGVCATPFIWLWDVGRGRQLSELLPSDHDVATSLAFSRDNRLLASGQGDGVTLVWEIASGKQVGDPIPSQGYPVTSVAFDADGTFLATAAVDSIEVWNIAGDQWTRTQQLAGHPDGVNSVAFSPYGQVLASGGGCDRIGGERACGRGDVRLWSTETWEAAGEPLVGHTLGATDLAFSVDRRTIASGGYDQDILLWDPTVDAPLGPRLTGHAASVTNVDVNADGTMLASGSLDRTVLLWDLENREPLAPPLTGQTSWIVDVAFNPDGTLLAVAGACGGGAGYGIGCTPDVRLWDVRTRQARVLARAGDPLKLTSVAFSPNGRIMAAGGCQRMLDSDSCDVGQIVLWDVETGQLRGPLLTGKSDAVWHVVFRDDKTLVSAGSEGGRGSLTFWDIESGQRDGPSVVLGDDALQAIVLNHAGTLLAVADSGASIFLFDVADEPRLVDSLHGHDREVNSLAFSRDGRLLASGGSDNRIVLWDVSTRQAIGQPIVAHTGAVHGLAFSPDGRMLVSGSADTSLVHHAIDEQGWRDRACSRANRNLSEQEWERFFPGEERRTTCDLPANAGAATATPAAATG